MPDTPASTELDDRPPGCAAFEELVNRVLDGDADEAALASDPHLLDCRPCRQARAAALVLLGGLGRPTVPVVPSEFVDRVARAGVRDFRRRRVIRWTANAGIGALAAALLIGWLAFPRSPSGDTTVAKTETTPRPNANTVAHREPVAESIRGQIGEAGSAVVALTRKATDDTIAPARNLFAAPVPRVAPRQPMLDLPDPLADMPEAAKAGLEPIADTAKRAVNLFLRDVGGAAGTGKMKS